MDLKVDNDTVDSDNLGIGLGLGVGELVQAGVGVEHGARITSELLLLNNVVNPLLLHAVELNVGVGCSREPHKFVVPFSHAGVINLEGIGLLLRNVEEAGVFGVGVGNEARGGSIFRESTQAGDGSPDTRDVRWLRETAQQHFMCFKKRLNFYIF